MMVSGGNEEKMSTPILNRKFWS